MVNQIPGWDDRKKSKPRSRPAIVPAPPKPAVVPPPVPVVDRYMAAALESEAARARGLAADQLIAAAVPEAVPPVAPTPSATLFEGGDLPAITASGIDPQTLLAVPWQARRAVAEAPDRASAYSLLEAYAGEEGAMVAHFQAQPAGRSTAPPRRTRRSCAWPPGPRHRSTGPRARRPKTRPWPETRPSPPQPSRTASGPGPARHRRGAGSARHWTAPQGVGTGDGPDRRRPSWVVVDPGRHGPLGEGHAYRRRRQPRRRQHGCVPPGHASARRHLAGHRRSGAPQHTGRDGAGRFRGPGARGGLLPGRQLRPVNEPVEHIQAALATLAEGMAGLAKIGADWARIVELSADDPVVAAEVATFTRDRPDLVAMLELAAGASGSALPKGKR